VDLAVIESCAANAATAHPTERIATVRPDEVVRATAIRVRDLAPRGGRHTARHLAGRTGASSAPRSPHATGASMNLLSWRTRPGREEIAFRDVGLGVLAPLWLAGGYVALYVARSYPARHTLGADAHAYWLTARHAHLYGVLPGSPDGYLYSPAFAQLVRPLAGMPWVLFLAVWMVLEAAAFGWLLAPLGWRWAVPIVLVCSIEIGLGNINAFVAVAVALGLRHPTAWALPLLTKVTPGLGPVWFAVRREWRAFAWTLGATCAVAVFSLLFAPDQWADWVRFLVTSRGSDTTVPYRLGAAIVLTAVAARLNRPWWLAIAVLIASPILNSLTYLTVLAAIPRLWGAQTPAPRARALIAHRGRHAGDRVRP
jgi:Glycosyltransferase family 87